MKPEDIEKAERIEKLLDRLRNEETIILVEGKKDRRSLRDLDINNELYMVAENAGPLHSIAQKISKNHNEAIILTDWDPHGEKLSKQLHEILERHGVTPNDVYRKRLKSMLLKEINDVESLYTFLKNKKPDYSWKKR